MLELYRPEDYRQVRRFAARLENFFYVRNIINWHTREGVPGACYVWREGGRVVAFQAVAYLNPDDAWLWGMRVDPKVQNQGIATRFTRALYPVIRKRGRTWVGLNTLERSRPAPTLRVMEKLGMRLECTHATDIFWNMPARLRIPRPARMKNIYAHYLRNGHRTLFFQDPGWVWMRLLPARRQEVNRNGRVLYGTPVHIKRHGRSRYSGFRAVLTTANLLDRPADMRRFAAALLGYAAGRGRNVVINYPADWRRELRAACRHAVPGLAPGRRCWFSAWRVYGKRL